MSMSGTQPRQLTPENLGAGVANPQDYRRFSAEAATVVRMYADPDLSMVVWNLEPGQENSPHVHDSNAQVFLVLEGTGVYLRGDGEQVPIGAGECVIIPRQVVHGIRNTGASRLSYLAFTTVGPAGYQRGTVGS
jgi:mannose-6-phosphate isomerase-like protein (cupin superfamily)